LSRLFEGSLHIVMRAALRVLNQTTVVVCNHRGQVKRWPKTRLRLKVASSQVRLRRCALANMSSICSCLFQNCFQPPFTTSLEQGGENMTGPSVEQNQLGFLHVRYSFVGTVEAR
jgi:hypothetical protein